MKESIYCREEKDSSEFSLEHILPQFIGGAAAFCCEIRAAQLLYQRIKYTIEETTKAELAKIRKYKKHVNWSLGVKASWFVLAI